MTYNEDKTWDDVSKDAGNNARQLITMLGNGLNAYDEWQSFRAGRTNAQIATALSRTEAEIADIDACYSAFKVAHDAMSNVAIAQGDYYYAMRKFS